MSQDLTTERRAFEAAALATVDTALGYIGAGWLRRTPSGDYAFDFVRGGWLMWQARSALDARAGELIELPPLRPVPDYRDAPHYHTTATEWNRALCEVARLNTAPRRATDKSAAANLAAELYPLLAEWRPSTQKDHDLKSAALAKVMAALEVKHENAS